MAKSSNPSNTVVAVLTADPVFEQSVRATFGASGAIELRVVRGTIASVDNFATEGATVVVVDLDAARPEEMVALEHMMAQIGVSPPVVVGGDGVLPSQVEVYRPATGARPLWNTLHVSGGEIKSLKK